MSLNDIYLSLSERMRTQVCEGIKTIALSADNPLIKEIIEYSFIPTRKLYISVMAGASYIASGRDDLEALSSVVTFTEAVNLGWQMIDDIIDNHKIRFNRPSPKEKYGQNETLLSALYLIHQGYSQISKYKIYHLNKLGKTFSGWLTKDIKKGKNITGCELTLKNIANSFGVFNRIASEIAGAPTRVQESLENYGYYMGYAMAILDECYDLKGEFGRPKAEEMRSGDDVLVVVAALEMDKIDVTRDEDPWSKLKDTNAHIYICNQVKENAALARESLKVITNRNARELLECVVNLVEGNLENL